MDPGFEVNGCAKVWKLVSRRKADPGFRGDNPLQWSQAVNRGGRMPEDVHFYEPAERTWSRA